MKVEHKRNGTDRPTRSLVLAFDVYGTLIDTSGIVLELRDLVGTQAPEFARLWREKQLEYSFRRGLMRRYENFVVCTRDALDYSCAHFRTNLPREARQSLLDAYRTLPAYADVVDGLSRLNAETCSSYAFSNRAAEAVETLLQSAGIREHFEGIVSVDEVRSFKPDPAVYEHFLRRTGAEAASAWLVSGNPFDVIGAVSAGMRAAWVRRSASTPFDPWDIEPTITVSSLEHIGARIGAYEAARSSG